MSSAALITCASCQSRWLTGLRHQELKVCLRSPALGRSPRPGSDPRRGRGPAISGTSSWERVLSEVGRRPAQEISFYLLEQLRPPPQLPPLLQLGILRPSLQWRRRLLDVEAGDVGDAGQVATWTGTAVRSRPRCDVRSRTAGVDAFTKPSTAFLGQRGISVRHGTSGRRVGAFSSSTPRSEVLPRSTSSAVSPRHQPPWVGHLEGCGRRPCAGRRASNSLPM